jgi:beta-galactosidase/beta-glucuronidase
LAPGEQRSLTQVVRISNPRLWSPEDPFLYVLDTGTGGDAVATRFGMREFRFDRATGWGYLNNKPYFLRGANITLHRFFEDPDAGSLPWQEKWVRKLLADLPKRMHWNSFRFCIGPVPDRWLDVADEAGLLIQNQFFIWVPGPAFGHQEWDLIPHFRDWMRDNWNHPSVAVWDTSNETRFPALGEKVIPAVRGLDLSNRPWHNSNNPAVDPDDPVERHLYVLKPNFDWSYFEQPPRARRDRRTNPGVVNEYGEFWLNRDGTPTLITTKYFEELVGANATPEERFAAAAYYLAGETEFHRAHRRHAAVQHFVYLTASAPGGYTADNFRDVKKLVLDPYFVDYVGESFKPLGVYLNFWQRTLKAGSARKFTVMMVNDRNSAARGKLVLSLESEGGKELARTERAYSLDAAGQASYDLDLRIPSTAGKCLLKAAAHPAGPPSVGPTLSRRKVSIVAE